MISSVALAIVNFDVFPFSNTIDVLLILIGLITTFSETAGGAPAVLELSEFEVPPAKVPPLLPP